MSKFDGHAVTAAQCARQRLCTVDGAVPATGATEAHGKPFSRILRVGGDGVAHQFLHRLQKRGDGIGMDGKEVDDRLIAPRVVTQTVHPERIGQHTAVENAPPPTHPSGPKSDGSPRLYENEKM